MARRKMVAAFGAALGLAALTGTALAPSARADGGSPGHEIQTSGEANSPMRVAVFPRRAQVGQAVTVLAAYRLFGADGTSTADETPLPLPDDPSASCPGLNGGSGGTISPTATTASSNAEQNDGSSGSTAPTAPAPASTSTSTSTLAVTFTIDFGDSSTVTPTASTGESADYAVASHAYSAVGSYTVTVTATPDSTGTTVSPTAGTTGAATPVVYTTTVLVGNPGADTAFKQGARIDGTDRYGTDVEIDRQEFPDCSATSAILATANSYKDALSAAPLATILHAPLFLTDPAQLPLAVQNEITRTVQPGGTIYILGGQAALTSTIDATVTRLGYKPVRIAGADAPATSVDVAQAILQAGVPVTKVVVGSDADFPDMTAAAAYAAHNSEPVLLTDPATLSPEVSAFLTSLTTPPTITVVGGPAALSAGVYQALSHLGSSITRLYGPDRYSTAVAVAEAGFPDPSSVTMATGTNFPDALAGGPFAAANDGPVLLVPPSSGVPAAVLAYLQAHASSIASTFVLGGTNAISTSVSDQLASAVGVSGSEVG